MLIIYCSGLICVWKNWFIGCIVRLMMVVLICVINMVIDSMYSIMCLCVVVLVCVCCIVILFIWEFLVFVLVSDGFSVVLVFWVMF